ncbi:hypothetical protein SCLCIDRAFT_33086 [Scleroderma citrinum Foug A]|uniref:Uncharacterized protein n=1 Tax=Scleroderma citrinum Foug A TaxID=1036808 RepID=A0A0C2ZGB9_9AGAM|nr:hypothetical protein SCLCIDRAFT_33086 [Scleroderma citrinum Foug A]
MVYKFKNWPTGNSAIPEVELIGHFARSFAQGDHLKRLDGWRVPGLGLTIVGPDVKFYAILSLDTQF